MDTLVSIGTLAAWAWSTVVLVAGLDEDTYFEVAAVITTLILLGRYLEARAKRRSGDAIRKLLELGAKDARVLRDGSEVAVPIDEVVVGDLFVVRPGEKVATDGEVVEGALGARPVAAHRRVPCRSRSSPGREVVGATLNTYGRLVVRATKVGADTALAQIARLVEAAQSGKAPVQRLADRVSAVFVPVVHRDLARHARGLAPSRAPRRGRVHGRRRRADHRLPVRARARDADRAHGRDRARRPARDPHQGARGARADAQDRDDRARQDGHRDRGQDGARPGRRRSTARLGRMSCSGPEPSRTHRSIRSRRRSQRRRGAEVGELPPVDVVLATCRVSAYEASSRATRSRSARRNGAITVSWGGEPRGDARRARHGQAVERRRAVADLRRLGLDPVLLTGDARRDRRRVAARGRDRPRSSPRFSRRTRPRRCRVCRRRARSSRWSATASTTRPRSRRPISGSRSGPARTSRSRRPT